jgi:hypothetical protein
MATVAAPADRRTKFEYGANIQKIEHGPRPTIGFVSDDKPAIVLGCVLEDFFGGKFLEFLFCHFERLLKMRAAGIQCECSDRSYCNNCNVVDKIQAPARNDLNEDATDGHYILSHDVAFR